MVNTGITIHSFRIRPYSTSPAATATIPIPYGASYTHSPQTLSNAPDRPKSQKKREKKKRPKKFPSKGVFFFASGFQHRKTPPKTSFLSILSDFFPLDDFAQSIPLVFTAIIGCVVGELDSMLRDELLQSKNDEIA